MKIYIDSDFKCHTSNEGAYREIETDFFNRKCPTLINGYRYVPSGEIWTREDGVQFKGEMMCPWVNYDILAEAQKNYEDGQNDILSFVEEQLGVLG